jgi:hypothetical protein
VKRTPASVSRRDNMACMMSQRGDQAILGGVSRAKSTPNRRGHTLETDRSPL